MVLEYVLDGPPNALDDFAPDAPKELISLCERAMAREKGDRLASAKELADQVRAYREGRTLSVYHYSSWELLKRFVSRNRRSVAVAMIALVLLAGTVTGLRIHQANVDAQAAAEAQAKFDAQVAQRRAELSGFDQRAGELDPEALFAQAEALSAEINLVDSDDPWSPRAAVARTNALTPERRERGRVLLEQLSDLIELRRSFMELAQAPVLGQSFAFITDEEIAQREQALLAAQRISFELALQTEEYTAAQLVLRAMELDASVRGDLSAELSHARDSVVNAWIYITGVALDDLEHENPVRSTRFDEVYEKVGFPPLSARQYARKLGGFRDQRVAEYLVERIQPYIAKATQPEAALRWTDQDRHALRLILTLLGDIQYPNVAVPTLADFFAVVTDSESGENLVVQTGEALCATESQLALTVLDQWMGNQITDRFKVEKQIIRNSWSRLRAVARENNFGTDDLLSRAIEAHDLGDHHEAARYARQALEERPNHAYAMAILGTVLGSVGEMEEALSLLERSLEIEPSVMAFLNRGILLQRMGRYNESIEVFDRLLEFDSNQLTAYYNKGNSLGRIGRLEEALECYQQVIQIDPTFAEVYAQRAHV